MYWNGEAIRNIGQLQSRFKALSAESNPALVRIYPSERTHFKRVAQVMGAAQRMHLTRLWLAPADK